jgi:hypothetical protein
MEILVAKKKAQLKEIGLMEILQLKEERQARLSANGIFKIS